MARRKLRLSRPISILSICLIVCLVGVLSGYGLIRFGWCLRQEIGEDSELYPYEALDACQSGDTVKLAEMIRKGADVYDPLAGEHNNRTCLEEAAINGHEDIVKLLLEHGVDGNERDLNGKTVLTLAKEAHQDKIVALLRHSGVK